MVILYEGAGFVLHDRVTATSTVAVAWGDYHSSKSIRQPRDCIRDWQREDIRSECRNKVSKAPRHLAVQDMQTGGRATEGHDLRFCSMTDHGIYSMTTYESSVHYILACYEASKVLWRRG